MKIKLFVTSVLAAMVLSVSAFADGALEYGIDKNFSENKITVSGKSIGNDDITVLITPETVNTDILWDSIPNEKKQVHGDYTTANAVNNLIVFAAAGNSGEDGSFTIDAGVKNSGKYNITVHSKLMNETKTLNNVDFISKDDYAQTIGLLNEKINDKNGFYDVLSKHLFQLGFEEDSNVNLRDVSDVLFNEQSGTLLSADEFEKNRKSFEICKVIVALNNGTKIAQTESIVDEIINADTKLKETYKKYVTETVHKEYLMSRLNKKGIQSSADLTQKIKEAMILTAVKYPDGYMNIKTVFNDYKDVLSLTAVSEKQSVYSGLAGNDYADAKALLKEYNSLAASNGNNGSGGGGSGSGGSSGRRDSSSGVGIITGTADKNNDKVTMKFDDLDTVSWAYEAISTLADEGIISGKSETKFAPRDNIKREEFVKLVIGVMNEQPGGSDVFSDISENDWFRTYANKANELGIVSGIGEGIFGKGSNITRQDMAVMLYRAISYKGIKLEKGTLDFMDNDNIADYAKEAVAAFAQAGIINGVGDGSFNPTGYATRAEAAKMIFGVYKLIR